ncbi:hypothetical protein Tco_0174323 [Tanacetum coccineum]
MPICEGSCRLTFLERQEVWNDCRSCKVKVGSNNNSWWEVSVLLDRKEVAREDDRRVTEGRIVYVKFSNNVEREQGGSYLDVEGIQIRLTNRWLSMKKDIASCGSKYLAYSEVEVEYQGSSGLLLQPELPE